MPGKRHTGFTLRFRSRGNNHVAGVSPQIQDQVIFAIKRKGRPITRRGNESLGK